MRHYKIQYSYKAPQYRRNRAVGVAAPDIQQAFDLIRREALQQDLEDLQIHSINDAGKLDYTVREK